MTATISDDSGIQSALIYYSTNGGAYLNAAPTNVNGSVYTFKFPAQERGRRFRKFDITYGRKIIQRIKIRQQVQATRRPATIRLIGRTITYRQLSQSVTVWPSPTNFNGPYPVSARDIDDDNEVLFASLHYGFRAGTWQEVPADGNVGNVFSFTIPAIASTTIIRYYLEAVDNSGFFNTGFHPPAGQSGPIVFQAVFTVPANPRAIDDLTISISGNDAQLRWDPITLDVNNNPTVIDHYDVYRGSVGDKVILR